MASGKGNRDGFAELCNRETGLSPPTRFSRRFSASEVLVGKLNLSAKLNGHETCVNAVEFNSAGDILVSGSCDNQVIIWNWATQSKRLSYDSGHRDIFQTKFMPFTDDRKIATSSSDGQVRLGEILDNGRVDTKILGKHRGRVYKLAVEPGNPHILYSCGEDGFLQHFDIRTNAAIKLFYCCYITDETESPQNRIRLNAIAIDPRNPNHIALGGSDEYARVYDRRRCRWNASNNFDSPVNTFCPQHLVEIDADVQITGLVYSSSSELLVTYNDELIYLFQKNMGMGPSPLRVSEEDLDNLPDPLRFEGHRNSQTMKGVNFFGPHDEYVMSGSDCGHIFIWRKKGARLVRVMVGDRHIVNHLEPHPNMPIVASCGIENNVKIWAPMTSDEPPLPDNVDRIMTHNWVRREDRARMEMFMPLIMMRARLEAPDFSAAW